MTDVDIASLLKNFAEDIKSDLKKEIQDNANISIRNHEETRKEIGGIKSEVHGLTNTVNVLWRKVNGPNVPPPKTSGEYRQVDASLAKEKPLAQSVSDHNLDLQSLQGQVKALDTKVDNVGQDAQRAAADAKEAKEAAEQGRKIAQQVLAMNEKQNESLGIGVSIRRVGEFLKWAKTKEGQRYVATLFAAATSLVTATGTAFAIITHRLPAPTDPVPVVHTVYVPVAVPPLPTTSPSGTPSHHP